MPAVTFLFIQGWKYTVVSADFEIYFLLYALWNGSLWYNNTNSSLYGAQHTTIAVKYTSCCGYNSVSIFLLLILKCCRAEKTESLAVLSIFLPETLAKKPPNSTPKKTPTQNKERNPSTNQKNTKSHKLWKHSARSWRIETTWISCFQLPASGIIQNELTPATHSAS